MNLAFMQKFFTMKVIVPIILDSSQCLYQET